MEVPNALVDVVLLVGMDDNTALIPIDQPSNDILDCLFEINYDPPVLSTITATEMVNLFPFPHRDAKYPPVYDENDADTSSRVPQRNRLMSDHQLSPKAQTYPPKRSYSVHPRFHAGQTLRSTVSAKLELPISEELQRSIPSLCFPDGALVYKRKPETTTHFLVLTDMNAGKTYATCLTFYRTYIVEKDDQGNVYMTLDNHQKECVDHLSIQCHVPQCCIMISKYPYYTRVKECLSRMLMFIEEDPEEMYTFLKDYAYVLTHTPVPPAGNIAVEFSLYQMPVILMPPEHPDKKVIDIPLHLTFLCFPTEELLKILSCVLLEERVVFLSSNYALLTIIAESIRHFILPFKSRYTYSPVLPSQLLGYLNAPGIFMFGCHSDHRAEAEQVEGLVLVDIDKGTVTINADVDSDASDMVIPELPAEATRVFTAKCSKFKQQFELLETQRPFCYNLEVLRRQKMEHMQIQNEKIAHACLEFMVNLFRGVVFDSRVELKHFNKDVFMKKQSEADKPFYTKVFKTDMFKTFLEDRMAEKSDYWSDLEMKTRKDLSSYSQSGASSGSGRRRSFATVTSAVSMHPPSTKREITPLRLPELTDTGTYAKTCISALTKEIQDCPDYDQRTSFVYLRCLFYAAIGNKMAAINDLINLSSSNIRILPLQLLLCLYKSFTEEEEAMFKKKNGHEKLLEIIEAIEAEEKDQVVKRISVEIKIPERDIKKEEFIEFVSLKEMSNDYDTISRLFEALTRCKTSLYVEHGTFTTFVKRWEDNQEQCSSVKIVKSKLMEEETVLKISEQIKTDYGIGRISLTDKRLFFLKDVSNVYQEIVKLRDIKTIERSQYQSFLSQTTDTLVIHRKEQKAFTIYLKEDRNWWYRVISEIWAGKVIAEATRDINAVAQAIQNTLLIDALIGCGQQDNSAHSDHIENWVDKLAFYTQAKEAGKHELPRDTREALQHKIDPNMGERERKTVQALLYTCGEDAQNPHLWCGLSDGKIKVYNAITWDLENESIQPKSSVACLTAMGNGQVWAGSFGIYVIDSETITCNKVLNDHSDLVVDIVLYNEDRCAFTASLDGIIIKWDVKKMTHSQPVQLQNCKGLRALKVHEDKLFCSTWSSILMTDFDGRLIHTFSHNQDGKLVELDSFTMHPNTIIGACNAVYGIFNTGTWSSILMTDFDGRLLHTFSHNQDGKLVELDSFTVLPNNEIWAGCRRAGNIVIWNLDTPERPSLVSVDCSGISIMALVNERLWIGTKKGKILIYNVSKREKWKELFAHEDAVRVLFYVEGRYVISGGGSKDGKIVIWSSTANTTDSGNFMDSLTEDYVF